MSASRPSNITRLETQLASFLERLGRTVEAPRPGQLVARHRTALVEEETLFKIVDSSRDTPLKRAINIFASHLQLPDPAEYQDCYYFPDFLDHTAQAERISKAVCDDPEITNQSEHFVPQHLTADGEPSAKDSISFFFNDWLPVNDKRLLAILAPAGYGKTVLTCAIAQQLASHYLAAKTNKRPPFPYLIPFGQFRRLASFEAMVLTSMQTKGVTDYTSGAFAYLVQQRRAVLILDGFDELLEERPDEARKNLRELIETLEGRGKVVVTARSTFFRTSDDVADFLEYYLDSNDVSVIELQPFDRAQRHLFVERHVTDATALDRVRAVVDLRSLDEAMGSPLLLRETVDAVQADAAAPESGGREALFPVLEKSVYARERQRHNHRFGDDVQRAFLEGLGREMLASNSRGFDWDSVRVLALEAANDEETAETELDRLADHHFLTVRAGANDVQFNHQVFREYFQARTLIQAATEIDVGWIRAMMSLRPLPEEVRAFVADLDADRRVPDALLHQSGDSWRPSDRLLNNIGALCGAYGSRDLVERFLLAAPMDAALGFPLAGLDLSGTDWSGRFLQGMQFVDCSLVEASFRQTQISELSLSAVTLTGASFVESRIDSLTMNYGPRIFGRADAFDTLDTAGAVTDGGTQGIQRDLQKERRAEIIELIRARLKRFYVAGDSDSADSRWDSSILERNLFGGVRPADRKFIRSKLIPRMMNVGILERIRMYGDVVYHLTDAAEDDARALMERNEITGLMSELVDRLVKRG